MSRRSGAQRRHPQVTVTEESRGPDHPTVTGKLVSCVQHLRVDAEMIGC